MSSVWNQSGLCKTAHHHSMCYLSITVGWKPYKQLDWLKRNCGVGTKIPKLKFHGFHYLGIFETTSLFGETKQSEIKSPPSSWNIKKHSKKPALHFANMFWDWWDAFWTTDVTILTDECCFSSDAWLCGHPVHYSMQWVFLIHSHIMLPMSPNSHNYYS
jgi:hypothetical protein